MGQNPYCYRFRLKFDDISVMLSLIVLLSVFFGKASKYYLTSYQVLLRLNVISMAKKGRPIFAQSV